LIQAVTANVNALFAGRFNPSICALIQIKTSRSRRFNFHDRKGGLAMPTETAIAVAGIVLVFAVFAVALAWAEYKTRGVRSPGAQYF
jgi:hypothetical protein